MSWSATLRSDVDTTAASAPSSSTDAELVQRTLAGEISAFEGIVQRYQERAFWAAQNMLGDAEEARDVAQEAFLRAYRSLDRFDFAMSFYTWLYRIVVNLCIDRLRRRSRMRPVALDDVGPQIQDEGDIQPDAPIERAETGAQVREVLDRLPNKYRTVMVLRELQGLSCKEIAAIVRSSHSTVRWRLHVARKMFREQWERRYRQEDAR